MKEADFEIASHGLRWIDYRDVAPAVERDHIAEAIRLHTEIAGERPLGFYQRLGYEVFGSLDDHPRGSQRYFMRKLLPSGASR